MKRNTQVEYEDASTEVRAIYDELFGGFVEYYRRMKRIHGRLNAD